MQMGSTPPAIWMAPTALPSSMMSVGPLPVSMVRGVDTTSSAGPVRRYAMRLLLGETVYGSLTNVR